MFVQTAHVSTQEQCPWNRPSLRPSDLSNQYSSAGDSLTQQNNNANLSGYPYKLTRRLPDRYSEKCPNSIRTRHRPSNKFAATASRDGLRRCQLTLQRALHKCTETDCQDFACVISCILSGLHRLQVSEIRSAVAMHAFAQRSETSWIDRTPTDFRTWLVSFGILFLIDSDDRVSFGVPEMPHFLSSFRIRGIDASHRTIAMISLAFVELNSSERAPGMPLEFLHYSTENWQQHYHIAARTSISLRYDRLTRQRPRLVERRSFNRSRRRQNSPPLDTVQRQFQTMDIDDDAEDWVFVEK